MLSLVLAAASDSTSKVPFFIAGGLLAVWAVTLSLIGLNRPEFPFGKPGQRAVIAISAALAVIAMAMAVIVA